MPGLIALVGGDEFRSHAVDMDRAIVDATGVERPAVVIIPTAAAGQRPELAAEHGGKHFSSLGADASSVMVMKSSHADDADLLSPIASADVIYFTGGNPAHLLDVLTDSLLLKMSIEAVERGKILAGSSAGAMVLGTWMRFREWREALGVVPDIVTLPHHERENPDEVVKELAQSAPPGVTAFGIDGATACIGTPGNWKALGHGNVTVYKNGEWRRYSSGEAIA